MLKRLSASKARSVPEDAPTEFGRRRWASHVFIEAGLDRRYYELRPLTEFRMRCVRETLMQPMRLGLVPVRLIGSTALFKRRPKSSTLLPAKSGRRHSRRWLDPRVEAIVEQTSTTKSSSKTGSFACLK